MCTGIKLKDNFPSNAKTVLLFRCISGQIAFFCFNMSLQFVPITITNIIFKTGSFWISILAFFFLNERISCVEIVGILLCFAGMVTITLSTSQTNQIDIITPTEPEIITEDNTTSNTMIVGAILALGAAWGYASCSILNRKLKATPAAIVMLCHGLFGLLLALTPPLISSIVNHEQLSFLSHNAN